MGARGSIVVVIAGLTLAPLAHAKPADGDDVERADADATSAEAEAAVTKDPKVAKKWHQTGQQLVRRGDRLARRNPDEAKVQYENAVTAFEKAIEAGDDPKGYFDLAGVEEKLGRLDRAAAHYRLILKARSGVRPDVVEKSTARFDELSMEVGLLTLKIQPEGATISLDGNTIATTPMSEPAIMMPGTYTLSLAAEGFHPKQIEIKIEAGSEIERGIDLEAIDMVVTPPKREAEQPVPVIAVAATPSRLPLYVGGGVAAGAVTIGVITGILATSRHGTFADPASSTSERDRARKSGEKLALVTDLALGTAVIAGGFTAYWYFVKYQPGKAKLENQPGDSAARAKVDVVPWVQSEAGGITVAGSF